MAFDDDVYNVARQESKNHLEEPMNTNQYINSIKEQNNVQNKQTKHALQKKTNLEKDFGIFFILFSVRLYRTDV